MDAIRVDLNAKLAGNGNSDFIFFLQILFDFQCHFPASTPASIQNPPWKIT